ncbi:MAG: hypothetical protein WC135_01065 [Bacteroidales bacterium]
MTKKIVFLFIFIFYFANSYSQDFKKIFLEINSKDKFFIITKPISSLRVRKITKEVNSVLREKQKQNFLDSNPWEGQVDAFRHIFLLYKLSSEIGIEKARRFSNIYESYNKIIFEKILNSGYDEASEIMDKFNNELGIYLFLKLDKVSNEVIIEEIEKQILEGKARKIKKDENGRSINFENKIIEDSIWKKDWKNKRELIKSNN